MNFKSKRLKAIIAIVTFCIIVGIVTFKSVINRPLKISSDHEISIVQGESFYSFLNELKGEGLIKNTFIIKLYTKLSNINLEIIPGQYTLSKDMSVKEIIELLKSASQNNCVDFTIPEGFTIDDISEKLEKEGICKRDDFIEAVKEYPLPSYIKENSNKRYNLEGLTCITTHLSIKHSPTNIRNMSDKRVTLIE